MDELVKMAYAMKKKVYCKGGIIFSQGDRSECVAIVKKGKISIVQKMTNHENKKGSTATHLKGKASNDIAVHIAELSAHDMVGIVELCKGFKKMKREVSALTPVEVFLIQSTTFSCFLKQEPKTSDMLAKVVEKRVNWENLRHDYALRFATIVPLTLPRHAATMSNYSISRNSVLSEQELLQRNKTEKELFRILKEARSMTRSISNNAKVTPRISRSKMQVFEDIQGLCTEAMCLADSINDNNRHEQASSLMKEARARLLVEEPGLLI